AGALALARADGRDEVVVRPVLQARLVRREIAWRRYAGRHAGNGTAGQVRVAVAAAAADGEQLAVLGALGRARGRRRRGVVDAAWDAEGNLVEPVEQLREIGELHHAGLTRDPLHATPQVRNDGDAVGVRPPGHLLHRHHAHAGAVALHAVAQQPHQLG